MPTIVGNKKIDELYRQLTEAADKGDKLRRKLDVQGGLSATESDELSQFHEKSLRLQKAIEEEEKRVLAADFSGIQSFLDGPKYKVSRNVNSDVDGEKTIINAGWEIKNNRVFVPTSLGKMVDLYDRDVLFGEAPSEDKDAVNYYAKARVTIQPEYRIAYNKFIRECAKTRSESMAMMRLSSEEAKALSEGQDDQGGYLVPPDLMAEILVRLPQTSIMRRLARIVNTSRDRVVWPRVLPHATADLASIYSSGFVGSWVGETPAFSETDPGFGTMEISIKKLRAATKLSNDFVADAIVDVPAWLAQNGSENMGLQEDAAFISGLGTPFVPLGFLNDPDVAANKTVDVEGSTANTISNTAASNGSANKIINLAYSLPSQYAARAEWLMRRAIEGDVRTLVDGAGRYLWPAMTESGFIGRLPPLLGASVNNSEFMPNDGTDGNLVLAYGDFSNYIIAQRAQISTVLLRERFADTDQVGFILIERLGGALWNSDAIRVGKV